jgi:hypothetical protein
VYNVISITLRTCRKQFIVNNFAANILHSKGSKMFYFNKNNTYKTQSKYRRNGSGQKIRNRILIVLASVVVLAAIGSGIAFAIFAATAA